MPGRKNVALIFKERQDPDVRLKLCDTCVPFVFKQPRVLEIDGNVSIWSFLW